MAKNVFLLLAALLCAAAFLVSSVAAKDIAFTYDPAFVDTSTPNGEAYNMYRFLTEWLEHTVHKITQHTNDGAWTTALAASDVLIFSENTDGISEDAQTAIKDWVKSGKVAIITAGQYDISTWMTGLSFGDKRKRGDGPITFPVTNAGRWLGGPEQVLSVNGNSPMYVVDAVASGLECLYNTNDNCVAWRFQLGSGVVFMVAPDFYDFGPGHVQNGGWAKVVENMIDNKWSSPSSAAALGSWLLSLLALLQ